MRLETENNEGTHRERPAKRSAAYFMLIVSTFLHECGHAFSMWMREYLTPYALRLAHYVTMLNKEEVGQLYKAHTWSITLIDLRKHRQRISG